MVLMYLLKYFSQISASVNSLLSERRSESRRSESTSLANAINSSVDGYGEHCHDDRNHTHELDEDIQGWS